MFFIEFVFLTGNADKASVSHLTKECVSKLSDDCLTQCWFRFLHILSNPVDLCRVDVVSETPKFLHFALTSEKVNILFLELKALHLFFEFCSQP